MEVKCWNRYIIKDGAETGILIQSFNIKSESVTEALDIAQAMARKLNKFAKIENEINILTCNGYLRGA